MLIKCTKFDKHACVVFFKKDEMDDHTHTSTAAMQQVAQGNKNGRNAFKRRGNR